MEHGAWSTSTSRPERSAPIEPFELELDVLWAGVELATPPR